MKIINPHTLILPGTMLGVALVWGGVLYANQETNCFSRHEHGVVVNYYLKDQRYMLTIRDSDNKMRSCSQAMRYRSIPYDFREHEEVDYSSHLAKS